MRIWLIFSLLFITGTCIAGADALVAQDTTTLAEPVFAWATSGDLYVMQGLDAEAQVIASGSVQAVKLSPQSSRVAFRRGPDADASLWVVDVESGDPVQLDEAFTVEMVWRDEETLFYNTAAFDPNTGFEMNNDLWRVDVAAGTVTRYPTGGQINLSPDGNHLLLMRGGKYGEEPGEIWHVEPDDPESAQRLYTFDAIASGHHDAFYPQISWLTSDRVAFALPVPDLLYMPPDVRQPTQLVSLDMAGNAEVMGTIVTDLFAFPAWSPDGQHLLYSETDTGANTSLWLADADGSNAQIIDQVQHGLISTTPHWISETQYIYIKSTAYYIGSVGEAPYRWLEDAYAVPKIAGSYIMYIVPAEENLHLRVARLGDETFSHLTDRARSVFWDVVVPSDS